jgi:hypothetical protein
MNLSDKLRRKRKMILPWRLYIPSFFIAVAARRKYGLVPDLTRSRDIKINERASLRYREDLIASAPSSTYTSIRARGDRTGTPVLTTFEISTCLNG